MNLYTLILSELPFFYLLSISSITPGPNNVMLTASGMNFGYKKTIPHILGIYLGFLTLLLLCGFGVGSLYIALPAAQTILKIIGTLYLIYLSYRILTAGSVGLRQKAKDTTRPLTFIEAFGFQFINPKGVVFAIAAINLLPANITVIQRCILIILAVTISAPLSTHLWTFFGQTVARLFRDDKTRHIINVILALLLLATIPMMLL